MIGAFIFLPIRADNLTDPFFRSKQLVCTWSPSILSLVNATRNVQCNACRGPLMALLRCPRDSLPDRWATSLTNMATMYLQLK